MLSARKKSILKIIIGEHISTASPVASETVARSYRLKVSPATVRNEVVSLEREGYILRPHTSSGSVPSNLGYRYYVESLVEAAEIPLSEQRLIQHMFHQVEGELDEWIQLTVSLLVSLVRNAVMATPPRALESRLKNLSIVSLQEHIALLILVLRETAVRHQILTLQEAATQEELGAMAENLNRMYHDLNCRQISARCQDMSAFEEQVTGAVVRMMQTEDSQELDEPYLRGMCHLLGQPEFAGTDRIMGVLELMEQRDLQRSIIGQIPGEDGVQVIIGDENQQEGMQNCSVVMSRYGIPGELSGVIGVVGPTRMQYGHTIAAVHYFASLMSRFIAEINRGKSVQDIS